MRSRTLPIIGLAALTGCATMVSGRNQKIPINVQPVGARVCIDGRQAGTSPMVATLTRKENHVIVVEQDGYQPVIRALSTEVNPWIALNFVPLILIPGPIGLIVDVSTGAVHTFNVGTFDFQMQRASAADTAQPARTPCAPR